MERLQSALAKARKSRGEQLSRPQRTTRAEAQRPDKASNLSIVWSDLEEVRLNPRILRRNRVSSFEGGHASTHYDMLRTKLLQQMRANGWKRIAVTSPGGSCGKSTTATNLAFSLARQPDERVILAELDLRRPSIAKMLGIVGGTHQFSRVLAGETEAKDNMYRYGRNLALGTNRAPSRNPSELLNSAMATEILSNIESTYQPTMTIFDMPPMLVSDDTIAFLKNVDCVLLVAAAEASTIDEVDICERDLGSQTNVLGVVLNKCRYLDNRYGYALYD